LRNIQRSFYVAVGTFASAFALYHFTKATKESGSQSRISSFIEKWTPSEKTFEQRNALHTAAVEKAASDRHLFISQDLKSNYELRNPEYVHARPIPPYIRAMRP
jgi:hypothetical protein